MFNKSKEEQVASKILEAVQEHLDRKNSDWMVNNMKIQAMENHYKNEIFELKCQIKELTKIIDNFSQGKSSEEIQT